MKNKHLRILFLLCVLTPSLVLKANRGQGLHIDIIDERYIPTLDSSFLAEELCGKIWESNIIFHSPIEEWDSVLNSYNIRGFWFKGHTANGIKRYYFHFPTNLEAENFIETIKLLFPDKVVFNKKFNYNDIMLFENRTNNYPNDPLYPEQRYLNYIHCPEAWELVEKVTSNNVKIPVGVVDIFFAKEHPDYKIDSVYNYQPNLNTVNHGTKVVGTLAALVNNGIGMASPAGLITDIFAYHGKDISFTTKLFKQYPVKIINCSFGHKDHEDTEKLTVDSLLDYYNCLVVCSAGNGPQDSIKTAQDLIYPASYESTLSVTSVGWDKGSTNGINKYGVHYYKYTGTNTKTHQHNSAVDLCAPGYDVLTTTLETDTTDTTDTTVLYYVINEGTSFAAPIVSGIAAMMFAVNPCLTARQAKELLIATADASILDFPENEPYKGMLGAGMVDAGAAVSEAYKLTNPDLFIRDDINDKGIEPNKKELRGAWNSPDIRLFDYDDSTIEIIDINNYNKDSCFIEIRIKNRSCHSTLGDDNDMLYITKGKKTLKGANIINARNKYSFVSPFYGISLPSIDGDSTYIVRIPMATPNNNVDSSSVSRSFSQLFSSSNIQLSNIQWGFSIQATIDENKHLSDLLRRQPYLHTPNKKFAKNHNSVALASGNTIIYDNKNIALANLVLEETPSYSLIFQQEYQKDSTLLSDFSELYLLLSDTLMSNLTNRASLEVVDDNRVRITNQTTELSFVNTEEIGDFLIGTEVHFFSNMTPSYNDYNFDIQLFTDSIEDIISFTAVRDSVTYFTAQATCENREVLSRQAATLSSNTISEEASYTWFDAAMDTIGSGRQLTIQPDRSQTYTLKIQQSNNGYVASDTVSVRILDGRITTITPNPATSLTIIAYEVTENKSANITITDVSNTIRQTYPLNQSNGTLTISVDNMPKGVYYVTLNVDGAVADTKSLIIR